MQNSNFAQFHIKSVLTALAVRLATAQPPAVRNTANLLKAARNDKVVVTTLGDTG